MKITTIKISISFSLHHKVFKDTYLKYSLFPPLHEKFYTNDKVLNMGISECDQCTCCSSETINIEHVLLSIPHINNK